MSQKKTARYYPALFSLLAGLLLGYAAYLFLGYNAPIIKSQILSILLVAVPFILTGVSVNELTQPLHTSTKRASHAWALLLAAAALVYAFLQSALFDYFQPFSLYDDVIYITLAAFLLWIVRLAFGSFAYFKGRAQPATTQLLAAAVLLLIVTISGWNLLQGDFDFQNISGQPQHLFVGGQDGYGTYRIPSLLVIPQGTMLTNGQTLDADLVLAFAEARRHGSLDTGEIDLVLRRSLDGGQSWASQQVVRRWEDGPGKIGNATPVFDNQTGTLHLLHIAGTGPYETWTITSPDGGETFSAPTLLGEGIVGPGHGVQLSNGRLVVPIHHQGETGALLSDDHGQSWQFGQAAGPGNESEIASINGSDKLIMVARTTHPVSQPHDPLQALFAFSSDGGQNWSAPTPSTDIPTPICMASLVSGPDGRLHFATANDYYSRANLTIFHSIDGGHSFPQQTVIYPGPSGYAELGVLSNGDLLLFFENGAVEYDERLTLVQVSP